MTMSLQQLCALIRSDLHRYHGRFSLPHCLKALWFNRGFKITFYYRMMHYLYQNRAWGPLRLLNLYYYHLQSHYACELPYQTRIGPGFYFGHVFGTIINGEAQIGANVNMSHSVTLGKLADGKHPGAPIIGDGVYIAPGSKIIGGIHIGSGTAIGANAVVTKDTPCNAVMAGIPAQVLSLKGSHSYILNAVQPFESASPPEESLTPSPAAPIYH